MISKDDIKKLANLSRIEVSDDEIQSLASDMDSILEYVSQVSEVSLDYKGGVELGHIINVLREDSEPNISGTQSEVLIAEFPESKDGYLKVKKIL